MTLGAYRYVPQWCSDPFGSEGCQTKAQLHDSSDTQKPCSSGLGANLESNVGIWFAKA